MDRQLAQSILLMVLAMLAWTDAVRADAASECQMLNWEGQLAAALPACREAAEQGDVYAQNFMGVSYANGDRVTADAATSTRWFRKAADQGYAPAQTSLGLAYAIGFGIRQDTVQARIWLQRAAERGDALASDILGRSQPQDAMRPSLRQFAATMFFRAGLCTLENGKTTRLRSCSALIQQLAGLRHVGDSKEESHP